MAEPYIGQIILVAFNFAPLAYVPCDGRMLAIAEYDTLFNLIGTTYGGDGQTNFAVPDLRGRVPIGMGAGPALTARTIGEFAGEETVTLTVNNLPVHSHTIDATNVAAAVACRTGAGNARSPVGNVLAAEAAGTTMTYAAAAADTAMAGTLATGATAASGPAGSNGAHDNMQPYLVMNYCIAAFGIFPSST